MKRETKKQAFAFFVLFMFVGSSLAFALLSSVDIEDTNVQYFISGPLENQEEAYYLQRNIVVMKYFFSDECLTCEDSLAVITAAAEHFNGRLLVELINIEEYPEEAELLEIEDVPTIYLKGNSVKTITDPITANELITETCFLFFAFVQECSI
jgi:thiol-disulfide isomerase/thioredoxin